MKGRLVLINPDLAQAMRSFSPVVVETEGRLMLQGDDWARCIPISSLDEVTALDVRNAMDIPPGDSVDIYLTEWRELPEDDLLSESYLQWIEGWYDAALAERKLKLTSAFKAY